MSINSNLIIHIYLIKIMNLYKFQVYKIFTLKYIKKIIQIIS